MAAARLLLVLAALALPARALTINEVAELSKAGVEDATVIAQLQADGSRFVLSADRILSLRREGVSDAVIRAMIATRRAADTPAPAPAAAPATPLAERRTGLTVWQARLVPYYDSPWLAPSLPPISYTVGPNPPWFVNGAPGTYGAPPRPCGPPPRPFVIGPRPSVTTVTVIPAPQGYQLTAGVTIVRTAPAP